MLGSFGFFASRGMTTVPNLSGLSRSAAEAAITAAGLTIGTSTSTGSSISSQDNIVSGQSVPSGQVVDYEATVNFGYYTYVAPSPGGGGTTPPQVTCTEISRQTFTSWSGTCSGGFEIGTQVTEISYSNCNPSTTPPVAVERVSQSLCGNGGCIQTSSTSSRVCDSCSGGYGLRECTMITTTTYSNGTETVTYTPDGTRDCRTAPAPTTPTTPTTPPATTSVNWTPGTPANQCIDGETEIIVVNLNGTKSYVKAKDVNIGDYVLAMKWDELVDENVQNFMSATSSNLTNIETLPTLVIAKYEYEKPTTMYINNDITTRMSLEQPMLISRDGVWQWKHTGDIYIGDKFIKYISGDQVVEIDITSVDYISEMRNVYSFNCEDTDTFFAGNILVHNK